MCPAANGEIHSEWLNGMLRYYDSYTAETIDVVVPSKLFEEFQLAAAAYNIPSLTLGVTSASDTIGIGMVIPPPWLFTGVNSASMAVVNTANGVLTLGVGAADLDDVEFASSLIFAASRNCSAEARIAFSTTLVAMAFGFSDATSENADTLAMTFDTVTLTTTASNAALIFFDSAATSDVVRACSVKADADGTTKTTTTAMDTNYHIYRVDVDSTGGITYWMDGVSLGTQTAGITTSTPLCVYLGVARRGAGTTGVLARVDYIRAWQGRDL